MNRWTPPGKFDGYELVRLLGRGGMGEVHIARDTLLERNVAVKFISASIIDQEARQRFLVEARAVARLQHPNVVSIFRIGVIDGFPYLVSELVSGKALSAWLSKLDAGQTVKVALEVASAIASAHRQGIIHRDIKPANVILSEDGIPKLLDFGIAKFVQPESETQTSDPGSAGANHDRRTDGTPQCSPASLDESSSVDAGQDATPVVRPQVKALEGASRPQDPQAGDQPEILAAYGPYDMHLTDPGMLLGSPRYMAPEIWRGEPATFRSDVYSFGALVYALCSGSPPHTHADLSQLRELVLNQDALPLKEAAPEVDSEFASVVDRCLKRDPQQRYSIGNEVRAALARIPTSTRTYLVPEGNPYRGLRTFEEEHQNLFFGRDSETKMILEQLAQDPFVLVVGDSGVGKSSLCRAAVLPRIQSWLKQERQWSVVRLIPGKHPVTSLSIALAGYLEEKEQNLAAQIDEDPGGVGRHLRSKQGKNAGLVLFIDQLEELVTLSEPGERYAVARALAWLVNPTPGIKVLATVRGDFLSRLANLQQFGDHISNSLYFLRPLSAERIRDAVVGPAAAKDVSFESDDLVEHLVDAAEQAKGGLPLLQFALAELWEARGSNMRITRAALDSIGGVAGAVTRHADEVLARMLPEESQAAKEVLVALVNPDGTRSRKTDSELNAEQPRIRTAINALTRGRLIVSRKTEGTYGYEIAHEALVTGWTTFAQWMSADMEVRHLRERLRQASAEWERLDRHPDAFWNARQLREASVIDIAGLPARERSFFTESRQHSRRGRLLRVGAAIGVPLLIILVYFGLLLETRLERTAQVDEKLDQARKAVDQADRLQALVDRMRESSYSMFDKSDSEAAELQWAAYLKSSAKLNQVYADASQSLETALMLDMSREDVRRLFAGTLFRRCRLAEERHRTTELQELLKRLRLYDHDGKYLKDWHASAKLSIQLHPEHADRELSRLVRTDGGRLTAEPLTLQPGKILGLELAPGSYVLVAGAAGHAEVRLPIFLRRAEIRNLALGLPVSDAIPPGFAYVPPGRFLFGSAADDDQRREFFHTVPIHDVSTKGFLIARYETTFAQWIEFLNDLPQKKRAKHLPRVGKGGFQGALSLKELAGGSWQLRFKPANQVYQAQSGQSIVYPGRKRNQKQDWLRFPVSGISAGDAQRYCAWLDQTGRVKGARLCTEHEWERAARGADGREFPHGWALQPEDANYDETYGKDPQAMGPDEVGGYAVSRSPFGLYDMAGNVWEWTSSSLGPKEFAARGGSYYFGMNSCRVTDREVTEPSFRDVSVGFRVCADIPPPEQSVK
ncbi:MAG TPA: SUMF1/EgtB/PvdO family nonheme iron enzyme [Myxococcota bacterium]|nr:SUMF1/EgtB/PvdO family nonheme iron enzyme [Myxococcota bacterium]